MLPFIHILSGKYLTSILTIPRPAILQRTLSKVKIGQGRLYWVEPDSPVLRMFGHLENVESNIDKSNVSRQLQKVHYLHVLVKALKPEEYSMNSLYENRIG